MQQSFFSDTSILIEDDGFLTYQENYLDVSVEEIVKGIEWRNDPITMFGKTYPQPRLTAWYGDMGIEYTYSKIKMTAMPWTPRLFEIKEKLQKDLQTNFNSVLINFYRDGSDHMSYHSDNEPELGQTPTIASLSFGAERIFQLKHKYQTKRESIKISLQHGSLLVMSGDLQHYWVHKINKTAKPIGPRLNLTFRYIHSKENF
jgi:alkylated DNA repair dioxygenase AlkB